MYQEDKGKIFYVYIYLDDRKPGCWEYNGQVFDFQPFYIGMGQGVRMEQHTRPYYKRDGSLKSKIINRIISATGKNPIFYKAYEDLTREEAWSIEIDMISHFGRRHLRNGGILANIDPGGQGEGKEKRKPKESDKVTFMPKSQGVNQYDLNGEFIQKFDAVFLAVRSLVGKDATDRMRRNIAQNITNCCKDKTGSSHGFIWKFDKTFPYTPKDVNNSLKKEVFQYSLEGRFIQRFETHTEASKFLNLRSDRDIGACASGKKLRAYGFQWKSSYLGEFINPVSPKSLRQPGLRRNFNKPISSFDLMGRFVKNYPSATDATLELGISSISRALSNPKATIGGYYWRRGLYEPN